MVRNFYELSAWVLALEMLICFAPLALLFVAILQAGFYLPAIGARPFDPWFVVVFASAVLGPLGLLLAGWVVLRPALRIPPWLPAAVLVIDAGTNLDAAVRHMAAIKRPVTVIGTSRGTLRAAEGNGESKTALIRPPARGGGA